MNNDPLSDLLDRLGGGDLEAAEQVFRDYEPYLRKVVPNDPWGRPYVYVSPGKENPTTYDLYSLGRDGKVGGEGEDADITSWGGPVRP